MSIDLDTLAVSGQYLSRFGEQLANTGQNLLGASQNWTQQEQQRQKEQQQQQRTEQAAGDVFLDAQSFIEVSAATSYMNDSFLQFTDAMAVDSDYETTVRKWTDRKAQMEEDFASMLKLQRSKEKFVPSWQVKAFEYEEKVRETVRAKLGAKAEAAFAQGMEKFAKAGDVQGMTDYAVSAAQSGSVSHETVSSTNARMLPVANYNRVFKELDVLGDADVAQSFLLDSEFVSKSGLTPEQAKTMAESFNFKSTRQVELAKRALLIKAEKANESFMTRYINGEVTLREEISDTLAAVTGTDYATGIKGILDKWDAYNGTGIEGKGQRKRESVEISLANSFFAWQKDGRPEGKEPWNPDMLEAMFAAGTIAKTQNDVLTKMWQTVDTPVEMVNIMSRLYGAMEDKVDSTTKKVTSISPRLAVKDTEIKQSFLDGKLGMGEQGITNYKTLMTLWDSLGDSYEKRPNTTSVEWDTKAKDLVFDQQKTRDEKDKWLRDNKAHFSGDDLNIWLGRVDITSGNNWKKPIFDSLDEYYRLAMAATTDDVKRSLLASKKYEASVALEAFMIANPEDRAGAEAKMYTLKGVQATRDLEDVITQVGLEKGITWTPARPDLMTARRYGAAREAGILTQAAYPAEWAEYQTKYRPIEVAEEVLKLKNSKIVWTTSAPNGFGDEEYVGTDGNHYVVIQVAGQETVRKVTRKTVTNPDGTTKTLTAYEAIR